MSTHKISAFEVALQELHAVAKVMNLSDEVVGYLSSPASTIEVNIPLRMDDGSMKYFKGYRCRHNHALGPTRGGTRLHKDETMDDVKALAFWMTAKNALAGFPSGGGKGGIAVDPKTLSSDELQRLCRGYIQAIIHVIGPDVDVLGPDVGTPPSIMAWFLDEYERLKGYHQATMCSGKPLLLGGSGGRNKATGYGLVYNAVELLRQTNTTLEGKNIIIQGFGNLGTAAAEAFAAHGAKIIAVTNSKGGAYNPKGLDLDKVATHIASGRMLSELPDSDAVSNNEIWELPCDILVPCALQNAIDIDNASSIKARYIFEGANGPVTPDGEKILLDKGVLVMPGIAANCGGVLVSYFEQVQNRYCYAWEADEVLDKLEKIMTKTSAGVYTVAKERGLSLRQAAWVLGLGRVIEAMQYRGWVK